MISKQNQSVPSWVWLYRFFVAPLLLMAVMLVWPFIKKVQAGLKLRMKANLDELSSGTIWIHAASGEFEYAKPLLKILKETSPFKTMVTFFTPSYRKHIQIHPLVDQSLPLPLDLPGPLRSFLNRTKPSCLLISRTDFWPELLTQTILKKVPTLAFSVTQKKSSGLPGRLKARLLNMTDGVHCVSEVDRQNLLQLGVNVPIWVSGDTRYDQVTDRLANPKVRFEQQQSKSDIFSQTLIAGSTWPQDEAILFKCLENFLPNKSIFLILVPHEPSDDHFTSLMNRYPQFKFTKLSGQSDTSKIKVVPGKILYVDQVGVLADLYAVADVAFVGGSFKSQVHSVMEPLANGLPVVVGPKNKNNREAQEFANILAINQQINAVTEVNNSEELKAYLDNIRRHCGHLKEAQALIKSEISKRTGASQKIAESIFS